MYSSSQKDRAQFSVVKTGPKTWEFEIFKLVCPLYRNRLKTDIILIFFSIQCQNHYCKKFRSTNPRREIAYRDFFFKTSLSLILSIGIYVLKRKTNKLLYNLMAPKPGPGRS